LLETVTLNIDGRDIRAKTEKSILECALAEGIYIPHLCHHPDLPPIGACRLCIVQIDGIDGPSVSCSTPVANGMKITTKTEQIERMRRLALELILSGHPSDCGTCNKYLKCELQSLKQYLGVEDLRVRRRTKPFPISKDNPLFVHDLSRCVLCGRCVRACHELRGVDVLYYKRKGREFYIGTALGRTLAESGCRFCGACAEVCPTGAIMDKEDLVQGKNRKNALVPCRFACPAEIDIPRYIRFIGERNYSAATAVIREKVPFPAVLGYVCSRPCEAVCRRGLINQPVSIRDLKRYAARHEEHGRWGEEANKKPSSGKRIAVIGSGPAGLTAAYYLSKQGHSVTVFESLPLPGGMMRYGIPEYRLPREVIDREISCIETLGVEIRTRTRVESIDNLFENGYNSILVAVGTHKSQRPSIPGTDNEGVLFCVDFLRRVNLGTSVNIGRRVVVLGGGNAAFDCARVARRLGAERVRLACIESRADMPAACDEIEQGEAEGIQIYPSKTAIRILNNQGKVAGVEFLDVESYCFDDDKSLQLEVVEDSHKTIQADTVIFAIGQAPEIPEGFGLDCGAGGFVEIDPYTHQTCSEGVFAAGDAVNGAGSLIEAIASGRSGAIAVDRFLEGSGIIDERLAPVSEPGNRLGNGEGFAHMRRCEEFCAPPAQRVLNFCNVVQEMDEEAVARESMRCLQCDLRVKITTVKVWGSY
jgi:formate dehydrogenase beta subunit